MPMILNQKGLQNRETTIDWTQKHIQNKIKQRKETIYNEEKNKILHEKDLPSDDEV